MMDTMLLRAGDRLQCDFAGGLQQFKPRPASSAKPRIGELLLCYVADKLRKLR
jgi:hypothetical protein